MLRHGCLDCFKINVKDVLQAMEGHYNRGYGDRMRGAEIDLLAGVAEEAEQF